MEEFGKKTPQNPKKRYNKTTNFYTFSSAVRYCKQQLLLNFFNLFENDRLYPFDLIREVRSFVSLQGRTSKDKDKDKDRREAEKRGRGLGKEGHGEEV